MHQVIVTIAPDGTTQVSVQGVAGASCKDITRALESALGNVISDEKTNEYYKTQVKTTQQQRLK